jgi:Flp pilus assembly protein TadB
MGLAAAPSLDTLLVMLLGGLTGGGVLLLVHSLTPHAPTPTVRSTGPGRLGGLGRRALVAVLAAAAALALTRWVVAAASVAALAVAWPSLFGGARAERDAMDRLEGLAAWTESLRDTVAGAVGLEQAIPATAHAASPAISRPLLDLADRLRVRTPLPTALDRFAEDLDDGGADLIVSALILNARLRGPGLRQVLTSLASSVREDLDMRRRIAAGRASTRRSVQIVVGITLAFVGGLVLLNPGYLRPYSTFIGQLVLGAVVLLFAAGFAWMRRLARFSTPQRFLRPGLLRVGP